MSMGKGFEGTKGPWRFGNTSDGQRLILGKGGRYVCHVQIHQTPRHMGSMDEPEREANARLILEAGTVLHETGLTPRQLAEQRAELLGALRRVDNCVAELDQWPAGDGRSVQDWVYDAIANATQQRNATGGEG